MNIVLKAFSILLVSLFPLTAIDFKHPSDVVKNMKKVFKGIETYSATFNISVKEGKKSRNTSGVAYFKRGGRLNFTFQKPYGDKIISDGRKMWVYIASLRAVGVQDLQSKSNIYNSASYKGLVSLFRRYHYRFDRADQPISIGQGRFYVLQLNEKTASGGFSKMKLFVDAEKYLIRQIDATSESGRKVTLKFSNIKLNNPIANNKFTYRVKGNTKVIENPLTTE